ncbi:Ig-like domain-containing protein [Clostridium neuense]|uniref:Ig-like domain-containing protein n=1 Tax=Clostridium neuense TaxID=1728934 RepID=A0ABW8THR4_9CLOT
MKNKIFPAVFLVFFLLLTSKVKAVTFTDNQIVASNKIWTINFSDEVGFDAATKNDITVRDDSGNSVPVQLMVDKGNNKSIKINPPSNGYTPGGKYTLNIGNNVHSSKSKNVKNKITMHFSIKSDDVNYKIGDSIRSPESDEKFEILDIKKADVDGDSKSEDVILAGLCENEGYYDRLYLILLDPETGAFKNYKYIEEGAEKSNTGIYLNDYTGDGVQDIRLNLYPGGNSCDGIPMIFSDKNNELKELDLGSSPFDYEMSGKRIAKITLHSDNSSYTIDLSKDSSWMEQVNNGSDNDLYVGFGPNIKDGTDEDGVGIFTTNHAISGAFHADIVANVTTTFKYNENEQKFVPVNQKITSQYPCTKIQSDYLKTEDYKNQNADIEMEISSAYTDGSGNKFIKGYCYKRLSAEELVQYERTTGNEVQDLYYDENGNPSIDDDGDDIRISDDFILPVDDSAKIYKFDIYSGAKSEISFSSLSAYQYKKPFQVTISNGKVLSISEEYRP